MRGGPLSAKPVPSFTAVSRCSAWARGSCVLGGWRRVGAGRYARIGIVMRSLARGGRCRRSLRRRLRRLRTVLRGRGGGCLLGSRRCRVGASGYIRTGIGVRSVTRGCCGRRSLCRLRRLRTVLRGRGGSCVLSTRRGRVGAGGYARTGIGMRSNVAHARGCQWRRRLCSHLRRLRIVLRGRGGHCILGSRRGAGVIDRRTIQAVEYGAKHHGDADRVYRDPPTNGGSLGESAVCL